MKFQITSNNQTWNKEIKISILPPEKFELNQNYPNPFNPSTIISYTIPGSSSDFTLSKVTLKIYGLLGQEIETLVDEALKPGFYKTEWNASNYSSGMYVYQISMKKGDKTDFLRKKMLLVR